MRHRLVFSKAVKQKGGGKWFTRRVKSAETGWWGRGDSNPHALEHMILSHARLPIPALPQAGTNHEEANKGKDGKVNPKVNRLRLTPELLRSFLDSRRNGLSKHTITFYHNCLRRFIGQKMTPRGINDFLRRLRCGNARQSYFRTIRILCNWPAGDG